jgi:hypothetical protein
VRDDAGEQIAARPKIVACDRLRARARSSMAEQLTPHHSGPTVAVTRRMPPESRPVICSRYEHWLDRTMRSEGLGPMVLLTARSARQKIAITLVR